MALTTLKAKHAGPGRHADVHGFICLSVKAEPDPGSYCCSMPGSVGTSASDPRTTFLSRDARILAANLRKTVRSRLDPTSKRRVSRKSIPTFEEVARDCYDAMKGGWKDQRPPSWMSSFERHVFPQIGGKAVTAIDNTAVLTVLGSGLVDQSQKMTVAASAMAEKKTVGHRS